MAEVDIPVLVKHVALAIYESGDVHGEKFKKIVTSLQIARGRLVEYGFLQPGSEHGPPDNIRMTVKGVRRNLKHVMESGGKKKTHRWDRLYALISEGMEDGDSDGEDELAEQDQAPSTPSRTEARRRKRLTNVAKRAPRPRVGKARKRRRK